MGVCTGVLQIQAYEVSYRYACFTFLLCNSHVRTYIRAGI